MDNLKENEKATADPAEAEKITAAPGLGKFKDVQTLLKAYSDLEAEFTRRSQRLKELEKGNKTETLSDEKEIPPSQNEDKLKELALSDPTIRDAVIGEYLKSISESRSPVLVQNGEGIAAPKAGPKTVRDAGRLAAEFFKK